MIINIVLIEVITEANIFTIIRRKDRIFRENMRICALVLIILFSVCCETKHALTAIESLFLKENSKEIFQHEIFERDHNPCLNIAAFNIQILGKRKMRKKISSTIYVWQILVKVKQHNQKIHV